MREYREEWYAENGYGPEVQDDEVEMWENLKRERKLEERKWTKQFFHKMFGILQSRSGQWARGLDAATVKERVDMVALYTNLTGKVPRFTGRRYVQIQCVFHGEDKMPSMSLDTELKRYKCFGCGESGDCYTLHQKLELSTFRQALEALDKA